MRLSSWERPSSWLLLLLRRGASWRGHMSLPWTPGRDCPMSLRVHTESYPVRRAEAGVYPVWPRPSRCRRSNSGLRAVGRGDGNARQPVVRGSRRRPGERRRGHPDRCSCRGRYGVCGVTSSESGFRYSLDTQPGYANQGNNRRSTRPLGEFAGRRVHVTTRERRGPRVASPG